MNGFDPSKYSAVVAELIGAGDRSMELGPGRAVAAKRAALAALRPETIAGARPRDLDMARAAIAGLWLYFDFLDESHHISQDVATTTGSYWHGIMHRREPDSSNAKYWFNRVGSHPVFVPLAEAAGRMARESASVAAAQPLAAASEWDPFEFVDLCSAAQLDSALEQVCRRIQLAEWQLLFDHSWRAAFGG